MTGLLVAAAQANPSQVATYRDWIVYTAPAGDDTICYAVSEPTQRDPESVDHGDVFFAVATWKSGKASDQPSFLAGYDLREGSEPSVRVGANRYTMFADGDEGFVESDQNEARLVNAMKAGAEMRVSALSQRGTATEYTFSLLGITNALERAARACE
ncbi:hypothetical protein PB2503_04047 [Parvularcula bermudensis HTCC2503]|uniref:Uncharacterized protein n=2 Tax=Parvularcula TaxID=208215 RepID=E0TE63_PARBH|nr:hypothetical protein PB2503_04047 [Parvularcula bermudensis HTCC2503]